MQNLPYRDTGLEWTSREMSMTRYLAETETTPRLTGGPGRGPGGQPIAALLPASRCPVAGCDAAIDPTRLMCRRHWYAVPRWLRDRVWRTWHSGAGALSPEHRDAVLQALAAVTVQRQAS
jgi:hypothetical protein